MDKTIEEIDEKPLLYCWLFKFGYLEIQMSYKYSGVLLLVSGCMLWFDIYTTTCQYSRYVHVVVMYRSQP